VGVSAGGAFGFVTGDYRYAERPSGSHGPFSSGKFGKTDLVFGAYASGIATYRIEEHGDLYLGLQFMSMSDSTFRQGGREAKLGLGAAFYVTAGINWPF
jgi:predicted porin